MSYFDGVINLFLSRVMVYRGDDVVELVLGGLLLGKVVYMICY